MKVMDLDHISVLPYLTCNFRCSYCIAGSPRLYKREQPFGLWEDKYEDVVEFFKKLSKKMVLVSGGEPLLWARWKDLIRETDHLWYFVTNTSYIPSWLSDSEVKSKVKLFLSAFHRSGIIIDRYIDNVKKIQDMGYPIFTKVIYTKDNKQLKDAEKIINSNIPMSFVPLVGVKYTNNEINQLKPYCQSDMYFKRFSVLGKLPCRCIAGTSQSFQVDGLVITRCSHQSSISLNNVPKMIRSAYKGYVGDIYSPKFFKKNKMCDLKECFCENLHFTEILNDSENPRWQKFIECSKWKS